MQTRYEKWPGELDEVLGPETGERKMVLADDVTLKAAAAVILQAMKACEFESVPILYDAWEAACEAHSEGDSGNSADCAEAFIAALADAR